jgi:methylmalonyl-CoA mutase N-terminal domain/subunit
LLAEIADLGGAAQAINRGYFQDAIAKSAYSQQRAIEAGEQVVVGVNRFAAEEGPTIVPAPDYSELAARQIERVRQARSERDARPWRAALDNLERAAAGSEQLMPSIIEAVRARATVGEISDTLRRVWGTFRSAG